MTYSQSSEFGDESLDSHHPTDVHWTMLNLGQRLDAATSALSAVSESPRTDAEYLLSHALGISRAQLLARLDRDAAPAGFDALLQRRLDHEPVAYILGEWEFYSLDLEIRAPMLVPRPETEHLVEVVLEHVADRPARILEIGTGTGCVAIAIAKNAPASTIVATDINPDALALAGRNAARHGLESRIEPREGSVFDPVTEDATAFDVICSNPPYVEESDYPNLSPTIRLHEDRLALVAGPDGLSVIKVIIAQASRFLVPGGLLALELGLGQYATVRQFLLDAGFVAPEVRRDLAGIERIAYARRPD
jgi:release factor glutamine methyltransferase